MIIRSNLAEIMTKIVGELNQITNDKVGRAVATSLVGNVRHRVHTEGLDSSGNKIGNYSDQYLAYRQKHGRTSDPTVVVSLTGQTENDFSVQPSGNGGWGLGYHNELNYAKAKFVENTYNKSIFKLTTEEEAQAVKAAEAYTKEVMGG